MKRAYIKADYESAWSDLLNSLENELDDGIDPLYDLTDAGEQLQELMVEVEDKLGILVEPSIQAGSGGVWIYDKLYETIVEDYDYEQFNEEGIDIALSSKGPEEFKQKYKKYLVDLMEQYR